MAASLFHESVNRIIDSEIEKLVNEIAWIDARILELGDDDESAIEKKLLQILRKHLMRDLYTLAGFVWDEEEVEYEEHTEKETTYVSSIVLELAGVET